MSVKQPLKMTTAGGSSANYHRSPCSAIVPPAVSEWAPIVQGGAVRGDHDGDAVAKAMAAAQGRWESP